MTSTCAQRAWWPVGPPGPEIAKPARSSFAFVFLSPPLPRCADKWDSLPQLPDLRRSYIDLLKSPNLTQASLLGGFTSL